MSRRRGRESEEVQVKPEPMSNPNKRSRRSASPLDVLPAALEAEFAKVGYFRTFLALHPARVPVGREVKAQGGQALCVGRGVLYLFEEGVGGGGDQLDVAWECPASTSFWKEGEKQRSGKP